MATHIKTLAILSVITSLAPVVAFSQSCSVVQVSQDFSYQDTFNSSGAPLSDAYVVFQQDRFYVNQQGRLDPNDRPDPVMVNRGARSTYGQAIRAYMNANGMGNMPAQVLVGRQYTVELEACGSRDNPSMRVLSMRVGGGMVVDAPQPTIINNTVVMATADSAEIEELQDEVDDLADQVALLQAVVDHQRNSVSPIDPDGAEARITAVTSLMDTYSARLVEVETFSSQQYSTPIRPQNQNQGTTARRLSEIFPKVPFYIAGTEEIGEMWVEPEVTDQGYLVFGFNFIDPLAEYDQVRDTISFTSSEIELVSAALTTVDEWTNVAQENGVRRNFERLVTCIPDAACENLQEGVSSSAVVFQIYEDGSTAAKIQRNRGLFVSSYNFSVESGLLLSAYLDYMREVGTREFTTGTMTEDDLNSLFE